MSTVSPAGTSRRVRTHKCQDRRAPSLSWSVLSFYVVLVYFSRMSRRAPMVTRRIVRPTVPYSATCSSASAIQRRPPMFSTLPRTIRRLSSWSLLTTVVLPFNWPLTLTIMRRLGVQLCHSAPRTTRTLLHLSLLRWKNVATHRLLAAANNSSSTMALAFFSLCGTRRTMEPLLPPT